MVNNISWKKLAPHLIAIAVFLLVSVLFCKPALEGKVLYQSDMIGTKGMIQNSLEYHDKYGTYPLWNPNLFSGMPNYQVLTHVKSALPDMHKVFTLWLPEPVNFFFAACICFYILCMVLGLNTIVAIFGGLAYAFAAYNPVIIVVGHITKMMAIDYMPLLLAGILLVYRKKYWLGFAVTTFGAYMEVSSNHPQITYYFLIVLAAITAGYLVKWIKAKEYKHIGIAALIVVVAGSTGAAVTATLLMTTKEYAQYTMRGGKTIDIKGNTVQAAKTTGLDASYAFSYSMSMAEPLVMMMPKAFGESSGKTLGADSKTAQKLSSLGVPESQADQFAANLPAYWGGMSAPGEMTAGPPYSGVIVCILALLGFILAKGPLRWGLLAAAVIGVVLSWGKYFPGVNLFLLDHLPLYNKFRAPSMALVMDQFVLPLTAALAAQFLFFTKDCKTVIKDHFKKICYTLGGLVLFLLLLYVAMSYTSPGDSFMAEQLKANNMQPDMVRAIFSGLQADRQAMFGGQVLRTVGFVLFVLLVLWLFVKSIIKPVVAILAVGAVSTIDLLAFDAKYMNDDNYVTADDIQSQSFQQTPVDEQILKDKDPDFRVFNMAANTFNESRTSYYFKSVGGYNPAKLRIYQDVIERYLSDSPDTGILNALNTKYIIVQNPKAQSPVLVPNASAYGSVWFVKNVKVVKNDVDELQAIGATRLKDTAVVQQSFAAKANAPQWDSAASIKLTQFDNDTMRYESSSAAPQFAVFSEVYYPAGWNAYIDGKKTDYVKADYLLRGLAVPAGNHKITFIFEPEIYKRGNQISFTASILVYVFTLGGFFMAWYDKRK